MVTLCPGASDGTYSWNATSAYGGVSNRKTQKSSPAGLTPIPVFFAVVVMIASPKLSGDVSKHADRTIGTTTWPFHSAETGDDGVKKLTVNSVAMNAVRNFAFIFFVPF